LLEVSRDTLLGYASEAGLQWIEDPSNTDVRHQRNYLRHDVIPRLASRWPAASQNLARSARHFAEALSLLDAVALEDLAPAQAGAPFPWLPLPSLALVPLRALSDARQRNAMQAWLLSLTRLPDAAHWAGWTALRDATADAVPLWALTDGAMCRAGDRAWWLAGPWQRLPALPPAWVSMATPLALPDNGTLLWHGPALSGAIEVRYRQGGERLVLPRGTRDLKRLLNEAGVPGFVRGRLPLLFADGHLVAVANLPALSSVPGELRWQPPTVDRVFEMKGAFR
jgi:tRNA(Ile)-lysidine synthase